MAAIRSFNAQVGREIGAKRKHAKLARNLLVTDRLGAKLAQTFLRTQVGRKIGAKHRLGAKLA